MATQSRLIKKYPNRRLYDTRTSTYITLADIKELVLAHEGFQVVDAKSGDDLTRASLRFGLGRFNTAEEVEFAIETVGAAVERLRKLRGDSI